MLKANLEKVVQHGKRADSIVKNMLLHSREGSGEHRAADINALVEESLNLAYHGARAEKIRLQHHAAARLRRRRRRGRAISAGDHARVAQPDLERLLCRDQAQGGERRGGFEPTLLATTKDLGRRRGNPHPRQRHRHSARGEGEDVQSVLHHQAGRRGHRASACR